MNITESPKNPSLSEDLTVIFLRGNGSPRTFRVSLPALQRSLTAAGFAFTFALFAAIFLLVLNLFHATSDHSAPAPAPPPTPTVTSPAPAKTETGTQRKGGIWQSLTGSTDSKGDPELQKEVQGLRDDIARLNSQIDSRKEIAKGESQGLLQFFGPRNIEVPADSSPIQVKNVVVIRDPATKQIYVDFELHNVDPDQRQARGYIVVLGKTRNLLATFPDNALAPSQNIVLDFTKGETFAVSRFRQARATFAAAKFEDETPRFQVLLFANDGKVIADLHAEETH